MTLFRDSLRDEKDINEIFSYIYTEFTSLHQNNEPLRILLQYFAPLFDLALGAVVFNKKNIKPLITYPLYNQENIAYVWDSINKVKPNENPKWINLQNQYLQTILEKYNKIKPEIKSFCMIPIKGIECIQNDRPSNPIIIGWFALFSRLEKDKFHCCNRFLKVIQHNITASFLQPTARLDFLYKGNSKHIDQHIHKKISDKKCNCLNKVGDFCVDWYKKHE